MLNFDVKLSLFVGPTVPVPVPMSVIEALVSLEVTNRDEGRDGFQLTFTLGRGKLPTDFDLLASQLLDPPNRVVVMVMVKLLPIVLIDGIITQHQMVPSHEPGATQLVVTGQDVSLKLDLEEKQTTFPNQPDSVIVTRILGEYAAQVGLVPAVTSTTDTPIELQRVPAQRGTDLAYVKQLAQRNSYVFYIEPLTLGVNQAYWGPDTRASLPQPTLTHNMDAYTNVLSMNFTYDALTRSEPTTSVLEQGQTVAAPTPPSLRAPLAASPAAALRRVLPPGTAGLSMTQAGLRAQSAVTQSFDALQCTGELDTARYMNVLRARRLVGVRGHGANHNGLYYVKQVTHRITRNSYRQSFTLVREGRGTTVGSVIL
jgi:phage protein D